MDREYVDINLITWKLFGLECHCRLTYSLPVCLESNVRRVYLPRCPVKCVMTGFCKPFQKPFNPIKYRYDLTRRYTVYVNSGLVKVVGRAAGCVGWNRSQQYRRPLFAARKCQRGTNTSPAMTGKGGPQPRCWFTSTSQELMALSQMREKALDRQTARRTGRARRVVLSANYDFSVSASCSFLLSRLSPQTWTLSKQTLT